MHLPTTIQEERLRWVLPVARKKLKLKDVIKVCPHGRRSPERLAALYRKYGAEGLIPKSTRPKSHPGETKIRIKERVIKLRQKTRKCALKLHWQPGKEGIMLHKNTIQKIIKREGLVRKYRVRRLKYKYIKVPLLPGELVEIDVEYVPETVENRRYYQFTAIDCASRWRYLEIFDDYSDTSSLQFLRRVLKRAPFRMRAIKTDNGGNFTNRYTGYDKSGDPLNPKLHTFDLLCQGKTIIHYLIDPGKPVQNGRVERSHRSD